MSDDSDSLTPALVAIGGYMETLREAAGLAREKLAPELGIGLQSIVRIDKGMVEGKILVFIDYLRAVDGSFADLEYIASLPSPTRADGEARARERLGQLRHTGERRVALATLDALTDRLTEAAATDPGLVPRLHGYLDALGVPSPRP